MAEYTFSTEINSETTNTHVFHFNMYIPYFEDFFAIREQFQSYSEMLLFLLTKYSERIYQIANRKKNCRKIYQPKTNHYERYSIRITDMVHELLSDYSRLTGLSMSYLIRLLIEWERNDYSDERGDIGYIPECERNPSSVTTMSGIHIHYQFSLENQKVIEYMGIHLTRTPIS